MAKKSGNGHDPVVTAIHELTAVVRELQAGQGAIEQVLRGHGKQLEALHGGLADVRAELHTLNGRMEHVETTLLDTRADMRALAGPRVQNLEERVAKLEAKP